MSQAINLEQRTTEAHSAVSRVIPGTRANSGPANYFLGAYKTLMHSDAGKHLNDYVNQQGDMINIRGLVSGNLGKGTLAAFYGHPGVGGYLIADDQIEQKVDGFGKAYGLDKEAAVAYIIMHELGHAAGNPSEVGAEMFTFKAAMHIAKKTKGDERNRYLRIAYAAKMRLPQAEYQDKHNKKERSKASPGEIGDITNSEYAACIEYATAMDNAEYATNDADRTKYQKQAKAAEEKMYSSESGKKSGGKKGKKGKKGGKKGRSKGGSKSSKK